jgi:hypothetical protein
VYKHKRECLGAPQVLLAEHAAVVGGFGFHFFGDSGGVALVIGFFGRGLFGGGFLFGGCHGASFLFIFAYAASYVTRC